MPVALKRPSMVLSDGGAAEAGLTFDPPTMEVIMFMNCVFGDGASSIMALQGFWDCCCCCALMSFEVGTVISEPTSGNEVVDADCGSCC